MKVHTKVAVSANLLGLFLCNLVVYTVYGHRPLLRICQSFTDFAMHHWQRQLPL